jgi:hypothetical protein
MRKAFASQRRLDCRTVQDVELNLDCRSEIVPLLRALKHLYSQRELCAEILDLVAQDVNQKSHRDRGRQGLDYWQIVVLAAVRLGCNLDYDALQDLAEQHRALRQMMGLGDWQGETFDWRRIRDNVCKLRPQTLERINQLIVAAGHALVPHAAETVRADSFVVETNIHYPTEASLIRDGLRKILHFGVQLAALLGLVGWRQHRHLYRKVKRLCRDIERIAARKGQGYQERLKLAYRELLELAESLLTRADELRAAAAKGKSANPEISALDRELAVFVQRTQQVCGTARRRVLQGEQVPNHDKLFSMFEPHTQLYKRGKAGQPLQFGRLALIYEDAAGLVCHYDLPPREAQDREVLVEQTRRLQDRLGGRIRKLSLDRGFHSPENQTALAEIIDHPCLPMPGKKGQQQAENATVEFRQARQRHPGIESAIGALQSGNGLVRSRDRSERGLERYLGLAVLGRNLHVLGKLLIARESATCKAAFSRRGKVAA